MYNTNLFEEEEYLLCKSKMDGKLFTQLMDICNDIEGEGIPGPLLDIIFVCEDKSYYGKFFSRLSNLKNEHMSRTDYFGNLIRVLAFTIFGYGNWSNNDRIRKGLKPIRFKQM